MSLFFCLFYLFFFYGDSGRWDYSRCEGSSQHSMTEMKVSCEANVNEVFYTLMRGSYRVARYQKHGWSRWHVVKSDFNWETASSGNSIPISLVLFPRSSLWLSTWLGWEMPRWVKNTYAGCARAFPERADHEGRSTLNEFGPTDALGSLERLKELKGERDS